MSEQQNQQSMTTIQAITTSACPHPEAVGTRWGDLISEEREAELQGYLDRWTAEIDHSKRKGPFDGMRLTGAEVGWLSERSVRDEDGLLPALHLEQADLRGAHLERANLLGAHLEQADLRGAHLEKSKLGHAHLERAILAGVQLEGANLLGAKLMGASLNGSVFDKSSYLGDAILTGVSLDNAIFDGTNLTVVDWSLVPVLGDERNARARKDADSFPMPKSLEQRYVEYKAAVRANRMLSVNLQAQGLTENAAHFAYRAQILQRRVLRFERKLGAYLFSWLLAGLAGYGYRLRRIFVVYGVVVLLFAAGYFLAGGVTVQAHLSVQQQALDALQVSLNAIHGRVFFTQLGLDTLQSWLATLESIVGIVIEGVFVAMLIQRFFAR